MYPKKKTDKVEVKTILKPRGSTTHYTQSTAFTGRSSHAIGTSDQELSDVTPNSIENSSFRMSLEVRSGGAIRRASALPGLA